MQSFPVSIASMLFVICALVPNLQIGKKRHRSCKVKRLRSFYRHFEETSASLVRKMVSLKLKNVNVWLIFLICSIEIVDSYEQARNQKYGHHCRSEWRKWQSSARKYTKRKQTHQSNDFLLHFAVIINLKINKSQEKIQNLLP